MLQHLRQAPICHQIPNTEQYIILLFHQSTLVYETKRSATTMCFDDTQTRSLGQNSGSRLVRQRATQLKLGSVEFHGQNCGHRKNCQNYGNGAQGILTETTEKSHQQTEKNSSNLLKYPTCRRPNPTRGGRHRAYVSMPRLPVVRGFRAVEAYVCFPQDVTVHGGCQ